MPPTDGNDTPPAIPDKSPPQSSSSEPQPQTSLPLQQNESSNSTTPPRDSRPHSSSQMQATQSTPSSSQAQQQPAPPSKDVFVHPEPPLVPPQRRPQPPAKGILKPPPPPVKPTFGNRLRDMVVGSVTGETPAPSQHRGQEAVNAAAGALNAISGRLGFGFGRFAARDSGPLHEPHTAAEAQRSGLVQSQSSSASFITDQSLSASTSAPASGRQPHPLRRVAFVLPSLSITYPISARNEPYSRKVLEERQRIEARQRSLLSTASGSEYWTAQRLVKLYESACRGREEKPRLGIIEALEAMPQHPNVRQIYLVLHDTPREPRSDPRSYAVDLPMSRYHADALADVLVVEWGLSDLRLERGVIESNEALKPILHALLVSGTLSSLSLAGNKKIKSTGWRLVASFLRRARDLKYIDLSETSWDRRGVEFLVQSLNSSPEVASRNDNRHSGESSDSGDDTHPYSPFLPRAPLLKDDISQGQPSALQSLRMDNCVFRSGALETLTQGIRTSELRHISLRRNRLGPMTAVALAVMIRDYPDTTGFRSTMSSGAVQDTALQYTPRHRRGVGPDPPIEDPHLPPVPLVTSSSAGGVTTRVVPDGYTPPPPPKNPLVMPGGGYSAIQDGAVFGAVAMDAKHGPDLGRTSLALQTRVRALDGVERLGNLATLDLKGNDIRSGVSYIAQVLKRNRTLRVLNLSDNKLDPAGLISLAESLKYNSTLETLDISSNPVCGPNLEGIASLRTSFTVNNSLKRLFLADTGLTTDGAIDLAEFIPENRSLLHLDVTNNHLIGTAGVLAIASGLKANQYIRCLDVSIPPNAPDLAELSQAILQSCIRNTELAATALSAAKEGKSKALPRGQEAALWAPIKKSALVRQVKEAEQHRAQKEREQVVHSVQGVARDYVYWLKSERIVVVAEETSRGLQQWYEAGRVAKSRAPLAIWEHTQMPKEDFKSLLEKARALTERIAETVQEAHPEGEELERLLAVNDVLTAHIANGTNFSPPPRILLPSQIASFSTPAAPVVTSVTSAPTHLTPRRRHQRNSSSLEISSPNFSLGDSEGESDAEELDERQITPRVKTLSLLDTSPSSSKSQGVDAPVVRASAEGEENAECSETEGETSRSAATEVDAADRLMDHELSQGLDLGSPVDRASRAWVEEEAEIFRKGTRLGVVDGSDSDSDDDDASRTSGSVNGSISGRSAKTGEELRQELIETEVPRSPPRSRAALNAVEDAEGPGEEHGEEIQGLGLVPGHARSRERRRS